MLGAPSACFRFSLSVFLAIFWLLFWFVLSLSYYSHIFCEFCFVFVIPFRPRYTHNFCAMFKGETVKIFDSSYTDINKCSRLAFPRLYYCTHLTFFSCTFSLSHFRFSFLHDIFLFCFLSHFTKCQKKWWDFCLLFTFVFGNVWGGQKCKFFKASLLFLKIFAVLKLFFEIFFFWKFLPYLTVTLLILFPLLTASNISFPH